MVSATGENLVFLLSTPRSGSTLLGAMLGSHSGIACPSEPWFLLRLAATYAPATSVGWHDDGLAARATRAFIEADTFRRGARELAAAVYNAHLARTGRHLFVDKTPRYYHIVGFLTDTFPQAKMIWLQRNPFAVAASFKTTWNAEMDVLTGRRVTPHTLDLVLALRSLAHHFSQPGPTPARLEVQYETLVTSPVTELRRVCDFLDIPYEDRMLRYGDDPVLMAAYRSSAFGDRSLLDHQTVHTDALDRWRALLSPDEIADITHALGVPLLRRMGYDPPPSPPVPPKPSPDPAVTTVLGRDRSPAEPSECANDPDTERVLELLNHPALADEVAQLRGERDHWRAAYREAEDLLHRLPMRIAWAIVRTITRLSGTNREPT